MMSSYSKTSVLVRPHGNEKPALFKISTLESVFYLFEKFFFGDRFHQIRVDKGNRWIHFQSERTQLSCTDKFVMKDEDLLKKDKGCDTLY